MGQIPHFLGALGRPCHGGSVKAPPRGSTPLTEALLTVAQNCAGAEIRGMKLGFEWGFHGDFTNFMVISWWFHGDLMVI